MNSSIIGKLFKRDVYSATALVLMAFISLFWFFDLVRELSDVGQGAYKLRHAITLTLLRVPGSVASELMPVAVLIGAVYSMARLASNSEFTILRGAGMTPWIALRYLLSLGLVIVIFTVVVGEIIAPKADELAQKILLVTKGKGVSNSKLASGHWVRNIRENDNTVETVNVVADKSGAIQSLRIYRFDKSARLLLRVESDQITASTGNTWLLGNALVTTPSDEQVITQRVAQWTWDSTIDARVLNVPAGSPEDMTLANLWTTSQHLKRSGQVAARHDLALWKKFIYPFTSLVMLALALPFAYLNARSGGVSIKVFGGIMLGLSFVLVNGLFSQLGLLNTWPPAFIAGAPSVLFIGIAAVALTRVMKMS
jgi:lipopolysaccharide export system permease protein